jgi:hypothetical protein
MKPIAILVIRSGVCFFFRFRLTRARASIGHGNHDTSGDHGYRDR